MEDKNQLSNEGQDLASVSTENLAASETLDGQAGLPIYVASRASVPERAAMWRRFRAQGVAITSSWIDEDGEEQTEDLANLWTRIVSEIEQANVVVLYAESGDFPLKGAFIEAGIALGMGKHVFVCLPDVELDPRSCRPIGSWINHPRVSRIDDINGAVKIATSFSYSTITFCDESLSPLEQEMERDAMIETIAQLEKDCDELRQVARMSLQQFEFQYGKRGRGWDAAFLMERLSGVLALVDGQDTNTAVSAGTTEQSG